MDDYFAVKRRLCNTQYIDCHSHQTDLPSVFRIRSFDLTEFASQNVLPEFYSVGVHPWQIDIHSEQQLLALSNNPHLLAIGECGLDKSISLALAEQIPLFEQQIHLAAKWHKPLIIHCVRAYNELLSIKSSHDTGTAWLIHGCDTSFQQLQQLLAAGFYCSFGSRLMDPKSKPAQFLKDLPQDRWLLETDANTEFAIDELYSCAARILGWELDALHQQMVKNFERIFINDGSGLVIAY